MKLSTTRHKARKNFRMGSNGYRWHQSVETPAERSETKRPDKLLLLEIIHGDGSLRFSIYDDHLRDEATGLDLVYKELAGPWVGNAVGTEKRDWSAVGVAMKDGREFSIDVSEFGKLCTGNGPGALAAPILVSALVVFLRKVAKDP